MPENKNQTADLVLEGGGVKGLGLVGALGVLEQAGYGFNRIAGTSAGAIVGALLAAGVSAKDLEELMRSVDYKAFRDEGLVDRFGPVGKAFSLVFENGIYEGDYFRQLLADKLATYNVTTFTDLKITDEWAKKLPPEQRYKLVVVTADISRGRLVYLPWDYPKYGLDPDTQLVADAVRASMSIPFYYEPVKLKDSVLVDGAVLSNFPVGAFDNTPDWPTFGIKLSARPEANQVVHNIEGPLGLTSALLAAMLNAHDQMHLDDPSVIERTIFIDTGKVQTTNFNITPAEQEMLFKNGQRAARKFISTWNYSAYVKKYAKD